MPSIKTEQQLRQEIDEWKEHIERFKEDLSMAEDCLVKTEQELRTLLDARYPWIQTL